MTHTPKIRELDIELLNDLFDMRGGWVLSFKNKTFSSFFQNEIGINIDDPSYSVEGSSKANRLRYFLRNSEPHLVVRTLLALWEYRVADQRRSGDPEKFPGAEKDFQALIDRLRGTQSSASTAPEQAPSPSLPAEATSRLKEELLAVSVLDPHPRGFAFERFLKSLFDAYGLKARSSFRLYGEQIDGSFQLNDDIYLLEAKWTNSKVDAATLRAFNSKVEDKTTWARGLFVSNSGFTDEGIAAFGRAKSVICMDGLDLYETLNLGLSFADVVSLKVRRAAETGNPFVRVRELNI